MVSDIRILDKSLRLAFFLYLPNKNIDVEQSYKGGQINDRQLQDAVWKNVFQGKLTYLLHWNKGEAMAPTIGEQGGTLLVRKIPVADPQ